MKKRSVTTWRSSDMNDGEWHEDLTEWQEVPHQVIIIRKWLWLDLLLILMFAAILLPITIFLVKEDGKKMVEFRSFIQKDFVKDIVKIIKNVFNEKNNETCFF